MNCPTCGNELKPGARFCTGCGTSMNGAPSEVPAHPPPAQQQGVPAPPPAAPPAQAAPVIESDTGDPQPRTPPKHLAFWNRMPRKTKLIISISAGALAGALLVLAIIHTTTATRNIKHFSGAYFENTFGFSISLPEKKWHKSMAESSHAHELALFYHGRHRPHAAVLHVLYVPLKGTPPRTFDDEAFAVNKRVFAVKAEKIVFDFDYTFTTEKIEILPDMGGRDGIRVKGKAKKKGKPTKNTWIYFAYSETTEFVLLFFMDEKKQSRAVKDVESIAKSFAFR